MVYAQAAQDGGLDGGIVAVGPVEVQRLVQDVAQVGDGAGRCKTFWPTAWSR